MLIVLVMWYFSSILKRNGNIITKANDLPFYLCREEKVVLSSETPAEKICTPSPSGECGWIIHVVFSSKLSGGSQLQQYCCYAVTMELCCLSHAHNLKLFSLEPLKSNSHDSIIWYPN